MSPTPTLNENGHWKPSEEEEDAQHKFMRKARDEPFVPIGMLRIIHNQSFLDLCYFKYLQRRVRPPLDVRPLCTYLVICISYSNFQFLILC